MQCPIEAAITLGKHVLVDKPPVGMNESGCMAHGSQTKLLTKTVRPFKGISVTLGTMTSHGNRIQNTVSADREVLVPCNAGRIVGDDQIRGIYDMGHEGKEFRTDQNIYIPETKHLTSIYGTDEIGAHVSGNLRIDCTLRNVKSSRRTRNIV